VPDPSNWGRWGREDERGTLNLLTPELVVAAAGLVKRGKVYSLGLDLSTDAPVAAGRLQPWHYASKTDRVPPAMSAADDIVDRAYEFLFLLAPLRLVRGIGSPVNPLAIA
jgi:hypothetical protein